MADFDWVKARAECSLPRTFERIFNGVQSDVEARNRISRAEAEGLFFEVSRDGTRVMITRNRPELRKVLFILRSGSIAVEAEGVNFAGTLGLNNAGDCTLIVNGSELELWQFRRMALERLFYDDMPQMATVSPAPAGAHRSIWTPARHRASSSSSLRMMADFGCTGITVPPLGYLNMEDGRSSSG